MTHFPLPEPLIGVLCSRACPAALILRAHDLARAWAATGVGVVGGFHSPTEAEMLRVLLRGRGPLVVVLARGLGAGCRASGKQRRRRGGWSWYLSLPTR